MTLRSRVPLAVLTGLLALTPPVAAAGVETTPVSFEVDNVNRSGLPCHADGERYRVTGRIVAPAGLPSTRRVATLYLHEYSFGAFFWNFREVPGYDYATALARAGHASVVIDRLGYDGSDHPEGLQTCLGAHADIARQLVARLKTGEYVTAGGPGPRFERVLLAGHSVGAVAAELAAISFDDLGIEGLLVFNLANGGYTPAALGESFEQGATCATGGEPAEPGGPGGYAFYGSPESDWQRLAFASAHPEVVAAATWLRNRDPCGDVSSLTPASAHNGARQGEIDVPVLLLWGEADAVYEPGTGEQEATKFSGSDDVTYRSFAGAGHAMLLEPAAPAVQRAVAEWLTVRGFVTPAAPSSSYRPPGRAATPPRRARPGLTVVTSPRRDRRAPWRFRTVGRIVLPAGVGVQDGCRGSVSVRFRRGRHTLAGRRVGVDRACRFRARVRLHGPRGPARLRVLVRFAGNRVLAPRRGRAARVRVA
jgi:alpha-beta hydrolase superfamily lysophospholipase